MRFYTQLAPYWPLLSEVADYEEEATFAAGLLASGQPAAHTVLELGSGGGHNAYFLKRHFALTLSDVSADMLTMSERLNPECEHVRGDMRTLRLGRTFDAVLIHDAIGYMTTREELAAAITTAAVHCRPGGVVLLMPDEVTETFEPGTDHGGSDDSTGRGARYLAWSYDPDPDDTWTLTEYAFLVREPGEPVTSIHDTHRYGLFPRDVWLSLMAEAGLGVRIVHEVTTEDRTPRELFLGTKTKA